MFSNFLKVSYESSMATTGCVISTKCPSLNTIFLENGVSKYCCNSNFCNYPNPYISTGLPTTTFQTSTPTTLTTSRTTQITTSNFKNSKLLFDKNGTHKLLFM